MADPFDFGGGIINPNHAANPGLIYDMGTEEYTHYLCSEAYNISDIRNLTGHRCPNKKSSILNLNQPSITIPRLTKSTTLTRTVTNVGDAQSKYKAEVEAPDGVKVKVRPHILRFTASGQRLSFKVTVTSTHKMNIGFVFGSLTWKDENHTVRIPLAVRTEYSLATEAKDEL
ncbi:unnamed protein product [Rhodiola kirilowii]